MEQDLELRNALGLDHHGGFENIRRGEELRFCDTPIGRLTVAICAGFFAEPACAALKTVRADYYLVPAMSPKTHDIAEFAQELVRHHGGSTAAANCGTVGRGEGSFVRSARWRQAKSKRSGAIYVYDLMELDKLNLALLSKNE